MNLKTFEEMQHTSVFFMLRPARAVYAFLLAVCGALVALFLWALFAPMDDVVRAQAVLRPAEAVSSVRCVASGELEQRLYENDMKVEEGELLFSLDTSVYSRELDACLHEQKKNEEEIFINKILLETMESERLPELAESSDAYIKSAVYISEMQRYEKAYEDARVKWERERDMPSALYVAQNAADAENAKEQSRLNYEAWKNSQKVQAVEQKRSLESTRRTLESRITELERVIRNSTIYAPISGRVAEVAKLNPGDYLMAGEEILRIVPDGAEGLKADIYVDPSYVAKVCVGDAVRMKFPGLPPSRYGMLETKIDLVPPDASLSQTGSLVFVVESAVPEPWLESRHGRRASLIPGITAEARIITDRTTVLRMVLRKLDFIN